MKENISIRASALGELFDCPARYEAKHLLGLRLPTSAAARLGTAVHAGAALFDQSRMEGAPLTSDEAAGAVIDVIYGKDEEVDWDEMAPTEAEKIALPLHDLYCRKVAPKQEYVAVEALCDSLTFTDIGLTLTGTVDRIRATSEGYGISDLKTGKSAVAADGSVKTQGHAAQLGVYELLASHTLGASIGAPAQIIGLQVAKTEKGRRAAVAEIKNARELLLDGPDNKPGLLRLAAQLTHGGNFYGNPRSQLCHHKYCPVYSTCKWRR